MAATKKTDSTALAVREPGGFPALSGEDASLVLDALRENLGGERITDRDLPQIGVPGGGGRTWEVPTLEGFESTPTLEGIIVLQRSTRAMWPKNPDDADYNPETDRFPVCSSSDAITGRGNPGGDCDLCPFSQWDSAPKGRGQACKLMRQMFLLREEGLLPYVLTLPPSSIKAAREFMLRLASHGIGYRTIAVTIGLDQHAEGQIKWSTATFALAGRLDPDEAGRVSEYAKALEPIMLAQPVYQTADEDAG